MSASRSGLSPVALAARVALSRKVMINPGFTTITGVGLGACSREGPGNRDAPPAEFWRGVKAEDARLADLSGRREHEHGARRA